MQSRDLNGTTASSLLLTPNASSSPLTASPPDFDFNMPCRYFKSSFARSLSLSNASKSLDYDINHQYQRDSNAGNSFSSNTAGIIAHQNDYPPSLSPPSLPQRLINTATIAKNTLINNSNNNNNNMMMNNNGKHANEQNEVNSGVGKIPPAIPARRPPLSLPIASDATITSPFKQQQQQQQVIRETKQQENLPTNMLTQFRNSTVGSARGNIINKMINHTEPRLQQQQENHTISNNVGCNTNGNNNYNSNSNKNVWPRDNNEQDLRDKIANEATKTTATITNTNAEYDVTSGGRMMPASREQRMPFEVHETETVNVEVVLLQNQLETLQWQLKQTETNFEMYRAVMQEVARFFERFHSQKQQQQQQQQQRQLQMQQQSRMNVNHTEQICRSKSLYQVYPGNCDNVGVASLDAIESSKSKKDEALQLRQLRARSSNNLNELKLSKTLTAAQLEQDDDQQHFNPLATSNSYSAFKDFTWRRSPKKPKELGKPHNKTIDDVEEKLSQEAFRLSRTINNLLNTSIQQPDLTQHRSASLSTLTLGRLTKPPAGVASPVPNAAINHHLSNGIQPTSNMPTINPITTAPKVAAGVALTTAADMLFLRGNNMRDSRLSLRSSTDSSVHSGSSCAASSSSSSASASVTSSACSKPELDEDQSHLSSDMGKQLPPRPVFCSTEDESGFSSISSLHDIGAPLSSTRLSTGSFFARPSQSLTDSSSEPHSLQEFNLDSRNSTLKASPPPPPPHPLPRDSIAMHPSNVVGLPIQHDGEDSQQMHRWDATATPSKTYRNAHKFQRFSTLSNEDAATVLWV